MDCYVYYRVAPEHTPNARAAVTRLFAAVVLETGVRGELQWRCGAADGVPEQAPATWMERYDDVPPGFAARLDAWVAAAGFDGLTAGPRHLECFAAAPAATDSPCA
ncbi:hypothetical protein PTE30175_00693 [Pandoraea terrae]|uniref:DUF4936 domain-containing protein n=1 Tax=Pandoraea terrae TaxID=1537710 RepID=A0A5E4SH31_9BURK|nr:DUF4936 family protein [Pandoraea terrae]VVD73488.1 hypothetical protein PTE30175_00693 [Pandoraea terrae]